MIWPHHEIMDKISSKEVFESFQARIDEACEKLEEVPPCCIIATKMRNRALQYVHRQPLKIEAGGNSKAGWEGGCFS